MRPGVLFISARLRPSGDTKSKARLAVCADTKNTVGCGLQAAETGINDCITQYEVVALQRGCGFTAKPELQCSQALLTGSLLPDGRIDLRPVASRYINSGFAFARHRPYTAPCQGSACFLPSPRISRATTLKGLGSIRPGFLHADKRKGRGLVLAGCLACEARKAGNQTIKRIVRIT